ncbi:MAG: pentapeptide repeat-containing protein [Cyanobacteria bacterium P01_H01_bin.58]
MTLQSAESGFKGQNLAGADFSGADIRSTNFTNANLTNANFTQAKAGLQRRWAVSLTFLAFLLSGCSVFFSAFVSFFVVLIFDSSSFENQVVGWVALVTLVTFSILLVRKGLVAGAGAGTVTLMSAYIGWRALKGDERDAWIRSMAIAFAAIGGTSFRGATLTDANFSQARLKSTDLRRAVLLRTRWRDAEKLDRVRPGESYLSYASVGSWY